MPTGYTADVTTDTTLEEFALKCARAFGALVLMRDDPTDAPISEFKPSDYHAERIVEAKARIQALSRMTSADIDAEVDKERSAKLKQRAESKAESDKKRRAYQSVLDKVNAWTPPTEEHQGLKTFMIEQLTESIRFDCHDDEYLDRAYPPAHISAVDWLVLAEADAQRDLAYHAKENAKEIARTRERNKWVRDLRDSLRK